MDMIIISLFCKLTKVSTNNFKTDIKGISGRLKMCKSIISVQICLYQLSRNSYAMLHEAYYGSTTMYTSTMLLTKTAGTSDDLATCCYSFRAFDTRRHDSCVDSETIRRLYIL